MRGHHERYDGKGYPDQLEKDEINIYAAIVSVDDTYHAMTRAEAIEELKRHKGTQFHPKIVNIFLQILEEESNKEKGDSALWTGL